MEDDTLEAVLARKYNITEKLVAEGKFVALCGIDKEAVQLTAAGISSSSFVIAGITLSGEEKDYDLISITSLSLIELGIQNYAEKKIRVKSQFKPTQIYQLCSCEDQDKVWLRFVRVIDSLQRRRNMHGYQWQTVPLEASIPLSGVDMQSADHEHSLASSVLVDMYPWRRGSDSCSSKSSLSRSLSATSTCGAREIRINLSRSTSSLPENHTDNFTLEKELEKIRKGQSVDCLDVTCKTSSVFSECESTLVLDLESKSKPEPDSFLNRSNNFLPAAADTFTDITNTDTNNTDTNNTDTNNTDTNNTDTNTEEDNKSTKSAHPFLIRLCRRLFCCKKSEK